MSSKPDLVPVEDTQSPPRSYDGVSFCPTGSPLPSVALRPVQTPRVWRAAQLAGVVLTVVLLAGLLRGSRPSLHLLWDMVIPLLPITFLINPLVWRNVCPLATLNTWTGQRAGPRTPSSSGLSEVRRFAQFALALTDTDRSPAAQLAAPS